jgi:hypothetical protein
VKGAEKYIERQKKTREKESKQIHSYPTGGVYIPIKREEKPKEVKGEDVKHDNHRVKLFKKGIKILFVLIF